MVTMNDNEMNEFEELASAFLENSLDRAGAVRLAKMLRDKPELDSELRLQLLTDSLMTQSSRDDSTKFLSSLERKMESIPRVGISEPLVQPESTSTFYRVLPWSLTAVFLVSTFLLWGQLVKSFERTVPAQVATVVEKPISNGSEAIEKTDPTPPVSRAVEPVESRFCRVVNEGSVQLVSGEPIIDPLLSAGVFVVGDSAAGLQFSSGTQVAIRGPAKFKLIDGLNIGLDYGSIRVVVPQDERGFTVKVPGGSLEDLGTEFGVSVSSETGEAELLVFEGRVNVRDVAGKKIDAVKEGNAIALTSNGRSYEVSANPSQFLAPSEVRFLSWSMDSLDLVADPDLIVYFPWRDVGRSETAKNMAMRYISGTPEIKGTRTVTGRWDSKSAMMFDSEGEYMQVELDDELPQLSVAAWININRLDHSINAIFDSNGWKPGGIHFQITRLGQVWMGVHGEIPDDRVLSSQIGPGRWHHVIATVDCVKHERRVYIDGKLSSSATIPETIEFVRPGSCRLGNWLPDETDTVNVDRGLSGRIDEFGVWKRVLDGDEVKQLWQSGNPYLAN